MAADTLASITINSLPDRGALHFDNTALTAPDVPMTVTAAELGEGKLKFIPVPEEDGEPYTTFTFMVSDGMTDSTAPATMTIDVIAVNDSPATGTPIISGVAQVGQMLSASLGDVADVDGIPDTLRYQWTRIASDMSATPIIGAEGKTYTLRAADLGHTLKVTLSFIDNDGSHEARTSDAFPTSGSVVAALCATPNFRGRTQIWSGVLTVEELGELVGYSAGHRGTLSDTRFTIAENTYTIDQIARFTRGNTDSLILALERKTLTSEEQAGLRLHICDDDFRFSEASVSLGIYSYEWGNPGITWSGGDVYTLYLSVPSGNSVPTAARSAVTMDEDTSYTFAIDSFNFTDDDSDDRLSTVRFATLPEQGSLTLDATPVAIDDVATRDDIDDGKLVFTPEPDANGSPYTSFTFKVSDGTEESSNTATMTVHVTPVNDLPTGTPTISGVFQEGRTLTADTSAVSDIDGIPDTVGFAWFRVEDDGTEEAIDAATQRTYTLVEDDARKKIKVAMEFTDNDGTPQSVPSEVYPAFTTVARAGECVAPNLAGRRQIWTERFRVAVGGLGGTPSDATFEIAENDYTIEHIYRLESGGNNILQFRLDDADLTSAETAALALHVCADSFSFNAAQHESSTHDYTWSNPGFTWASRDVRTLYLTLPQGTSAPSARNNEVTTVEDTAHTFAAAEFRFSDSDVGDALASVTIVALPNRGQLQLNATAVSQSQEVTRADLDAGHLSFTPAPNGNGDPYTTFTFTVSDGTRESAASRTMTIVVTAANDAPVGRDSKITATQGADYALRVGNFGFVDVDGDALASVIISSLPASGSGELAFDGTSIPIADLPKTVTADELGEGKLVYDPPATGSGMDFANFEFKVHDGTVESTAVATMTIDVVTGASVCAAPYLAGRRQIWTTELMVGRLERGGRTTADGFNENLAIGMLSDTMFEIGANPYTVDVALSSRGTTPPGGLVFS